MADNFTLKDSLATRKYEITNVTRILQALTEDSLSILMPVEEARAVLSDKLLNLTGQVEVNTVDIAAVTDRLLEAINELTDSSFTIAELRDGTVPISAVLDAIKSVTQDKKLVIYPRFNIGNIAGQVTSSITLSANELLKYDSLSWADEKYGSLGAPYDVAIPTLAALSYSDIVAVDLIYPDKTPVFNQDNDRVLGFVTSFSGSNVINITWGKMTGTGFVEEAIPVEILNDVIAVVPMKTNLSVMPVTSLALSKIDSFGLNQQDEIEAIQLVLSENKLSATSQLDEVLGLANVTVTDFMAATVHALFPVGFNNVTEAIVAILNHLQAILAVQSDFVDAWPYIGQVEEDAIISAAQAVLYGMSNEYTIVTVDSFRTDENAYIGADKAEIDTRKSLLQHGNDDMAKSYYLQQINGEVAGKSKVAFKMQITEPLVGDQDYSIDVVLEIKGGRYATGVSYTLVQYTNPLPTQVEMHELMEYDLTALPHNPSGDAPLPVLIEAGETMWLRIVIQMDSAGLEQTPVIRSYQLFV